MDQLEERILLTELKNASKHLQRCVDRTHSQVLECNPGGSNNCERNERGRKRVF